MLTEVIARPGAGSSTTPQEVHRDGPPAQAGIELPAPHPLDADAQHVTAVPALKAGQSWNRPGDEPHRVVTLVDPQRIAAQLAACAQPGLPYGAGRSFGDGCRNPGGVLWDTRRLDRFIGFDEASGELTCEAGVLLRDIQRLAVPRGWMLPVVPGTPVATVGGAIANDVHGKNHHVMGTFGDHVLAMRVVRTDGQVVDCGPAMQADWFSATVGGMGLTGLIVHATLQLRRVNGPWLQAETLAYRDIDTLLQLADDSAGEWEHGVAWMDCASRAGRGLFRRARPAADATAREAVARGGANRFLPLVPLANRISVRGFNAAYFHLNATSEARIEYHERFANPLGALVQHDGADRAPGLHHYQCALPHATRRDALLAMLQAVQPARDRPSLALLQTFGASAPAGMLSFPMHGLMLAFDFSNRSDAAPALFERLDAIVAEAGGRLCTAQDARMPRALFEAGNARLDEFSRYRDPGISSSMSRRLMGS